MALANYRLSIQDEELLDLAFEMKDDIHTNFRVFAILTYSTHDKPAPADKYELKDGEVDDDDDREALDGVQYVTGTNTETVHLGQSICAERAAVIKLRTINYQKIEKIYLVSDASSELAPGALCREFLLQFAAPDTPVITACVFIGNKRGWTHKVSALADLYPMPPLYIHVPGEQATHVAKTLAGKAESFATKYANQKKYVELYDAVVQMTAKDARDALYPIRYAAGVLFSNGDIRLVHQTKLLEFGHTIDPISKLTVHLEDYHERNIEPELIIQTDQYGIAHPPFGAARAHLVEGRYRCKYIVHDITGKLHTIQHSDTHSGKPSVDAQGVETINILPDTPHIVEASIAETSKRRSLAVTSDTVAHLGGSAAALAHASTTDKSASTKQ